MKKYILLLFTLPLAYVSMAQQAYPFVARSKGEYVDPQPDPSIKNVKVNDVKMVEVKTNAGNTEFDPYQIYGFRDKDGKEYRMFRGEKFQVLESGELSIYERNIRVTEFNDGGYEMPDQVYFFSNGSTGDILPLTAENVSLVYSSLNPHFVYLMHKLDWNGDLVKYDKRRGDYKIEEIYKDSKNTAITEVW